MTLSSMTGFARSDGHMKGMSWFWEVKSVNSRSLDVRCRLPQGLERLEAEIKELAQARFHRGSLQVNLELKREIESEIRVNETALNEVLALARSLQEKHGLPPPTIEGLLAVRGVLETVEREDDEESMALRNKLLLQSLADAFDVLVGNRRAEGAKLKGILSAQIERISELGEDARDCPARTADRIRVRLGEQIDRLLESGRSFDPDRLHQEALLIAARSDIQEELDRIFAHVGAARELVDNGAGPVGRKLDFLAQEFHREANTLCAKSQDKSLSSIGLNLKAVIDQMREQVQNVE
ncbi:MAG TPA: YicC/YloC family endoribonuclease [Aestuariivirgaceae bacterium]|jgi:uncharacterized protein (TIGR00255 family)